MICCPFLPRFGGLRVKTACYEKNDGPAPPFQRFRKRIRDVKVGLRGLTLDRRPPCSPRQSLAREPELGDAGIHEAMRERYFEDYAPGSVEEFGAVGVGEAEIIEFASRYDPQRFH